MVARKETTESNNMLEKGESLVQVEGAVANEPTTLHGDVLATVTVWTRHVTLVLGDKPDAPTHPYKTKNQQ
jgi:hypothetical protein